MLHILTDEERHQIEQQIAAAKFIPATEFKTKKHLHEKNILRNPRRTYRKKRGTT